MLAISPHTVTALSSLVEGRPWVLFAQCRPAASVAPIKIEATKNLAARLRAIDSDNPTEIWLLGLIETVQPGEAARAIQGEYEESRLKGEWFSPTIELLTFIERAAQRDLVSLLASLRPHSQPDGTLTIEEMAAQLNLSVPTLRRMVASGQIPHLRAGRQIRFVPTDVIASLQRRRG